VWAPVPSSKVDTAKGLHTLPPTGKTTDVVYEEVLFFIFIIRNYNICIVKNNEFQYFLC
jgi:hypothetical protein